MKAFTNIEQSKKLAEILPIESADMCFNDNEPCWSLAALLEALPTIDDGNRNPVICKDIRLNKWHIVYHGTAVEPTIDSGVYDNLIDACVEMILKLHEEKLL